MFAKWPKRASKHMTKSKGITHSEQGTMEFQFTQKPKQMAAQTSIDDYAKDGGEEVFTKINCVRMTNL